METKEINEEIEEGIGDWGMKVERIIFTIAILLFLGLGILCLSECGENYGKWLESYEGQPNFEEIQMRPFYYLESRIQFMAGIFFIGIGITVLGIRRLLKRKLDS